MSTSKSCNAEGGMKVTCQMCAVEGHAADCCRWVYSCCKEPNCHGVRKMTTSETIGNFGRKYLQCLTCSSFQWLDEAMLAASSLTPSIASGCFSCGETSHWKNACPWIQSQCKVCDGIRSLKISGRPHTYGWKYLKCSKCSSFQWLYEAVKETTSPSTSAEVTVTMKLEDFCNSFDAKCKILKK